MAHEITSTDNVVLHKQSAWHGLGIVVEDAPTPREALKIAGLDWGVEQYPLLADLGEGKTKQVKTHQANYRADTGMLLGVVTAGYEPVNNRDHADFCEALLDEGKGKVLCETAGSIRGGRKVWFLLKGEPFDVTGKGDTVYDYILVSNGHDGTSSFRVTPTEIRVVCSNTMHMVIPDKEKGQLRNSAVWFRHTQNIKQRVEQAKKALKHFGKVKEQSRDVITALAAKDVKQEDVQAFFLESYTTEFGSIPKNPKDKKESRKREKAIDAYNSFTRRFDDEKKIAGTNLWCAFNAFSGLVQHDMKARGRDDAARIEKRVESNLFGLNQRRTEHALQIAFKMVG